MKKILVVDDEKPISDIVKFNLTKEGYDVYTAYDGEEALQQVKEVEPDLILLDLMLPKIDGLEVAREVRKTHDMPIIMVTAKDSEIDKVLGLELGADDYVSKPFKTLELLARLNSQLRRYKKFLDMKENNIINRNLYTVGGIELDSSTKNVTVDGKIIKTTPIEFKILELMIKNPGIVFSAEDIYEKVWKERAVNTDTIMVHIRNIREKIEINPKNPKYLKVVWGVGYKIEKQ